MERSAVTTGEPTSYDAVGTFGELGRVLTDDINKVFQQTGIPPGERGWGEGGWRKKGSAGRKGMRREGGGIATIVVCLQGLQP